MDYGAALETRLAATPRGFESPPLRHSPKGSSDARDPAVADAGTLCRAVLGGELAVPCTCNPLQQG